MMAWWNKYKAWEKSLSLKQNAFLFCCIVLFFMGLGTLNERNTRLYNKGYSHGFIGSKNKKNSSSYMKGYNDGVKDVSFYDEGKEDRRKQLRPLYRDNYHYMRGYNECY